MNDLLKILVGDAREKLRELPTNSVHCIVTSPPYWGLRDYGVDGQLGLEKTPQEFISNMVEVFREARRVLRGDGVLFLNLGDSYFGSSHTGGTNSKEGSAKRKGRMFSRARHAQACDSADRAESDCRDCDYTSENPYDAHKDSFASRIADRSQNHAAMQIHESYLKILGYMEELNGHLPIVDYAGLQRNWQSLSATLDLVHSAIREVEPLLSAQVSTKQESLLQFQDAEMRKDNSWACLSSLRLFASYAQVFSRTLGAPYEKRNSTADIALLCEVLSSHIQYSAKLCRLALSYLNIRDIQASSSIRFKQKDLCMIPARLAIALCDDGWYLRSEIVWEKKNPMPESVTDRPTRSHEMVYLLTKQASYFYDAQAIREPFADERMGNPGKYSRTSQKSKGANRDRQDTGFLNNGDGWNNDGARAGRNKRTVWSIASEPTPFAHFATFPTALVEPMILAGTSAHGCCSHCGTPYERILEPTPEYAKHLGKDWSDTTKDDSEGRGHFALLDGGRAAQRPVKRNAPSITAEYVTKGWKADCACNALLDRCTVLDMFGGSGTVGRVALSLGRKAILIELNPEYAKIIERRCTVTLGLQMA